jgi:hypothetical protein
MLASKQPAWVTLLHDESWVYAACVAELPTKLCLYCCCYHCCCWLLLLALQCLCAGCAGLYDYAAKGCPMCRQPVEELLTMEL